MIKTVCKNGENTLGFYLHFGPGSKSPSTILIGGNDCLDGKEYACNVGDLVWSLVWENPLEKGMATHSSILGLRIP